jgi:hypothetical protein
MTAASAHPFHPDNIAMKTTVSSLALLLALVAGCSADVETTDDSVKVEAELPKVEVGDKAPDLDPRTDDDVDIDTPAPGDK